MYEAARVDDQIAHSNWAQAILGGIAAGIVVGAAVYFTGGLALVAIASGGFAMGAVQGWIGSGHSFEGPIKTGASRTRIGGLSAARAIIDEVECHFPDVIAQGSRTVAIEDYPAARLEDGTECGGQVGQGCRNVFIGADPETYVQIKNEVPWQWRFAIGFVMFAGSAYGLKAQVSNPRGYFKGLVQKGPNVFNKLPSRQQRWCGHPVDMGTGNVVDEAEDFALPGPIPVVWKRSYSSAQASEETSLGCGGWALDWEQWICEDGDLWTLRTEEGREIYFEKVAPGSVTYHRRERLTLVVEDGHRFSVYSHAARQTRRYWRDRHGGRALLRSVEDAQGNAVVLYYEGQELARIEDTAGRSVVVHRDRAGRIDRVEVWARGQLAQWVDYAYHTSGELASTTDALGHSDAFEYDTEHRMTKTTLKNGVSFYYAYDPETGRCIRTWGDGGLHTIELSYDLQLGTTTARGNTEPRVYYWDDFGLVRREETLDGRCLRICDVDDDGFVLAEGATEKTATRHEYDERGNRIRTVDPTGAATTWVYEGDVPVSRTDPDGLVTRFEHDERAALVGVTYPTGVRYQLGRDPHGRLTSVREGERQVASFAYDGEHNVTAETDAREAVTSYVHDPLGRPIERRDALDRVWRIERDLLGRPIAVHAPDGTVTRSEHDALGNVTRAIDALGQVTEMEYAGTGVLTRFTQPNGHTYSIAYDRDERLVAVENPVGERYAYQYDEAGRIVSEQTFDGRKLAYRYSEEGHLSAIEYPDATFRMFQRDARGLVTADIAPESEARFERDPLGRVTKAILTERSGKVVVEAKRDAFGRVIEEVQNERSIKFAYDALGRRTERVLPDGASTRYGYDEADELAWVEHAGRKLSLERDKLGREVTRKATSGFEVRSTYDEMDRLVGQHTIGGAAHDILSRRTWSYDSLGRLRETTDSRWGATVYTHDPIGQLLSAQRGAFREAFSYDPAGSLRKLTDELSSSEMAGDWEIQTGNRLTRTGDAEYTFDRRGRRVQKVALTTTSEGKAGEVTRYVWDARDRLREVKKPDGERVLFTYDALGRRVRKEILPAEGQAARRTVEFLWDGDELAVDIDSTRGTRSFVHEPGTFIPMLQAEQGEVFAVVNDHLGMPKELIDAAGRVAWSAAHSAWGKVVETYRDPFTKRARPVDSPFRLLGQYADAETGLCHTKFRYFDPTIGRWTSPDPLGIAGGSNLYGYDGSPLDDIDPLGLCGSVRTFVNSNKPLYRYMSKGELQAVRETGLLRGGKKGETFWTDSSFKTAVRAKDRLSLKDLPEYRVEFKIENNPTLNTTGSKVKPDFGGKGGGKEYSSFDPVEADIVNAQPIGGKSAQPSIGVKWPVLIRPEE